MASAQSVPTARDQVARPGGQVPGLPALALVKVADGFNDPVGVSAANDGTGRIFVVERVGRIKVVAKDGRVLPEPFLDLTKTNPLGSEVQTGFVEQGLWSVAFHPKFKDNGHIFVHYSSLPFNGASIVARYTVDRASPDRITTEQANKTVKVIMNIPQPYYNHYGGTIAFGPDGFLYVGKGDAGWEGDLLDAGQRLDLLWGKMLRIDVDGPDTEQYRIPPTNPMARAVQDRMMSLFGVTEEGFSRIRMGARPEIWAYGLRNPYMFHFDRQSGDLFIADVGQNHWEEINYQPKASKGGENYGWRHNQASHCHPLTGAYRELSGGGRPARGRVPPPGALSRGAQAHAGVWLLGAGARRGELRGHEQGVPRRRLVLGPPLGGRLGRLALAAPGVAPDEPPVHGGGSRRGRLRPRRQLLLLLPRRQGRVGEPTGSAVAGPAAGPGAGRRGDGTGRPAIATTKGRRGSAGDGPTPWSPGRARRVWGTAVGGAAGLALVIGVLAPGPLAATVTFRHIAFGTPLDVAPRPGEVVTRAVARFHETGQNPYAGDAVALGDGKRLYETWCQSCHMPDGSGRIGPSLIGAQPIHARAATDVGLFEAVFGGALGAMQSFRDRMTQDEILRVNAYVRSLRRDGP